jgi:putative ABC transport system permease protein
VEGFHPAPGQELQVDLRLASPDYFRTMGIALLNGRFFSDHDNKDAPLAAIIDAKFANRFWPRENPIGKHLWFDHPEKPFTIVGVVDAVKQYGLDNEGKIAVYFAHRQQPSNGMYLVARTSSDPAAVAGPIVRAIHTVEPNAAVYEVRTMDQLLHDSLARQRFSAVMLASFAGFALLLAAVGVYGVLSYLVSQNKHDIGVRVALGARPGDIVGLIVRQGMGLAAIGILAGLIGAFALTRVMSSLLFGIAVTDFVTFGSVCVILAAVALAASVIPARRATQVDPMFVLRDE